MSEPIVQTTKFNEIDNKDFLWKMYFGTHPVADFDQRPIEATVILKFICEAIKLPGTVLAIDSCLFGRVPFNITKSYELEAYNRLLPDYSATVIPTLWHTPTDKTYDNVIAVGSHSFKYMTVDRYAEAINYLLKLVDPDGSLIICMPKLHFQYHRLRYQPIELLRLVGERITGSIANSVELEQDFYLEIYHGQ